MGSRLYLSVLECPCRFWINVATLYPPCISVECPSSPLYNELY